jgi:FMN phosphatase YigB (HAD superfamily)
MNLKAVFFDFGFVIGYPPPGIERKYLYLDWGGIDAILTDQKLKQRLLPNIGCEQLVEFFDHEVYRVFLEHEQTDSVDPQSNKILLEKLDWVFSGPIDQEFVDSLLIPINTMKYITIDPRAVEVLAGIQHQGLYLALVSNMMLPGKLLKAKLREANLLGYFDDIVVSSDVGFIKPHPEIFRRALARSRLGADEVMFVGDTYQQDILGAKRVGMRAVWLNHRREPHDPLIDSPADFEIAALAELPRIVLGEAGV